MNFEHEHHRCIVRKRVRGYVTPPMQLTLLTIHVINADFKI